MTQPKVTLSEPEHVDMSNPVEVDLAKLREAWAHVEGAKHAWVIGALFALEDPEQALDDMELGTENLVGFNPVHCLWCHVRYRTEDRYAECPGPSK